VIGEKTSPVDVISQTPRKWGGCEKVLTDVADLGGDRGADLGDRGADLGDRGADLGDRGADLGFVGLTWGFVRKSLFF